MKPIIFVFGPSGVGKSYVSSRLVKHRFLHVHIDTDRRERTFAANGFPSEWDDDFNRMDPAHLVGVLRNRLDDDHAGIVASFPTVHVFTPEKLDEAAQLGVTPVLLWGRHEDCMRAAEKRMKKKEEKGKKKGKTFNLPRYEQKNRPAFQAYRAPEYDTFRVEAFRQDGSRYPDGELLARIMERLAG